METALRLVAILTIFGALSGCAVNGIPCSVGPIEPTDQDRFSRPTAEQVLLINNSGEKYCNWHPRLK